MNIKQMTTTDKLGRSYQSAYLFEGGHGHPGLDSPVAPLFELGSLNNGGMVRLVELANAVNRFFLSNSIEQKRDGLVNSRSYGTVYLVRKLLDRMDVRKYNLDVLDDQTMSFLSSLIATMLSDTTSKRTSLNRLSRSFYFPTHPELIASNIRTVMRILAEAPSTESGSEDELSAELTEKLSSWAGNDLGEWSEIDPRGMKVLVSLALEICNHIESEIGSRWEKVAEHLECLSVATVEFANKDVELTTRPTSRQLAFFYLLDIEPPDLIKDFTTILLPETANEDTCLDPVGELQDSLDDLLS